MYDDVYRIGRSVIQALLQTATLLWYKTNPTQRFGDKKDELLPKTNGKGAKLLQRGLFRQQALLYVTPTDKPGLAFYTSNIGSCLQEQSAEGSNLS